MVTNLGQVAIWKKLLNLLPLEDFIDQVTVDHQVLKLLKQFTVVLTDGFRANGIQRLITCGFSIPTLASQLLFVAVHNIIWVAGVACHKDVFH